LNMTVVGAALIAASAVIASVGGSMQAHYYGFVEPDQFDLSLVVSLVAMVVLGGASHWAGPLLGAAFFTFVPEWASGLGQWRDVATGAILLLVVRFAPNGVLGLVNSLFASRRMKASRAGTIDAAAGQDEAPSTAAADRR
jgi:branched-chain amino acid transport system permease protein